MLPTPTTMSPASRACLMLTVRPRVALNRSSAVKAGVRGSMPRPASRGWLSGGPSPAGCQSTAPKRRGSFRRRVRSPATVRSKCACLPGATPGPTIEGSRTCPGAGSASLLGRLVGTLSPGCGSLRCLFGFLPANRRGSHSSSRYLPRRPTWRTVRPCRVSARPAGTGQRIPWWRTTVLAMVRPSRCGAMPRLVTSTSGSSGIGVLCWRFGLNIARTL